MIQKVVFEKLVLERSFWKKTSLHSKNHYPESISKRSCYGNSISKNLSQNISKINNLKITITKK